MGYAALPRRPDTEARFGLSRVTEERSFTAVVGGMRAYRDRLGKNWSPRSSCHSIASAKYASPPNADVGTIRRATIGSPE